MTNVDSAEWSEEEEVNVLLPADMVAALKVAAFQRRSLGIESARLADLVQEAVSEWLDREVQRTPRMAIRVTGNTDD